MKAADRSGASHVVVIGDRDLAEGIGQLKDMRTGEQHPSRWASCSSAA